MAWANVQNALKGHGTGVTTGGQSSAAFLSTPTVGNWLVCWGWGWQGTGIALSNVTFGDSNGGNTWATKVFHSVNADAYFAVGIAKVAAASASMTVKAVPAFTTGGSVGSMVVCGAEFSGPSSLSADGAETGTTGTGATADPGSLAITAGSLVLAGFTADTTTYTQATPGGFTRVDNENDGTGFQVGEAVYAVGPASPSHPTWANGSSVIWAAGQAAFLANPGGAGSTANDGVVFLANGSEMRSVPFGGLY